MSSVDFKHRTSYNTSFTLHSFHGKTWAQHIDLLSTVWPHSSVGQSTAPASQRSWVRIPLSHLNFSGSRDNCLNCPASARIMSSVDYNHLCYDLLSFKNPTHLHEAALFLHPTASVNYWCEKMEKSCPQTRPVPFNSSFEETWKILYTWDFDLLIKKAYKQIMPHVNSH